MAKNMSRKERVCRISESIVKPHVWDVEHTSIPLSPLDYTKLGCGYIQKGFLFSKPNAPSFSMSSFVKELENSLSLALAHFYPLSGRLSTTATTDVPPSFVVCFNCADSHGAKVIHASADLSIKDILSPTYVPDVVYSFFDHDGSANLHGHFQSLLTLQVTELTDGVFVGCSFNHAVGDGASFWLFLSWLTQILKAQKLRQDLPTMPLPLFDRKLLNIGGGEYSLSSDPCLGPSKPLSVVNGFFHLNSETIAKLKASINLEQNTDNISSLQAVSALIWRSIIRVHNFPSDKVTMCVLACDCRARLQPRVPENYFGNAIYRLSAVATAGELQQNTLGWVAAKIHRAVIEHNDKKIRSSIESWIKSPVLIDYRGVDVNTYVMIGSSPKFNMYGVDFGFGKALAIRSGSSNKFNGKISMYPGREGAGSMDFEVSLNRQAFTALHLDKEFTTYVSLPSVN